LPTLTDTRWFEVRDFNQDRQITPAPCPHNHFVERTTVPDQKGASMTKKIAVVIRERQEEGLRMSLGLVLADDIIEVSVMDQHFDNESPGAEHCELLHEMDVPVYTNRKDNPSMEYLPTADIAHRLLECDHTYSLLNSLLAKGRA